MPQLQPFHHAFPVHDLDEARAFYTGLLGCAEGRSSPVSVDFNLHGHQIVAHLEPDFSRHNAANPVDGDTVPVPHFGVVLEWVAWHAFAKQLAHVGVEFVIEPRIRFKGKVGEQATMFFRDPSGNALEFKSFKDPANLFRSR